LVCLLLAVLLPGGDALALEPGEVLVLANRRSREGRDLARQYLEGRHIPPANYLEVDTTLEESCSQAAYREEVAAPVRDFIGSRGPEARIRAAAVFYGIPLTVRTDRSALEAREQGELARLETDQAALATEIAGMPADDPGRSAAEARARALAFHLEVFRRFDGHAALDSELALVMAPPYPVSGWVANPFYPGHRFRYPVIDHDQVLMVARLDGPDAATVRRIMTDSLAAEAVGLSGGAYFDARFAASAEPRSSAYAAYDRSLHEAAHRVRRHTDLPVTLDDREALLGPGEAPDAALYCGWYSLGRYVDAFTWKPGAVGYHMASGECGTLRAASPTQWCQSLLVHGAAATLGPVSEPFIQAFPPPERFFDLLTDGYLTLAECYLASLPYLSWKMVLVGDPLYRPFRPRRKRTGTHISNKDYGARSASKPVATSSAFSRALAVGESGAP
jgi:uncharacterized protein (TIGR03790 family)